MDVSQGQNDRVDRRLTKEEQMFFGQPSWLQSVNTLCAALQCEDVMGPSSTGSGTE